MAERMPKMGRVYRFKKLLFWAQGGCICILDEAAAERGCKEPTVEQMADPTFKQSLRDVVFKVTPRHEFAARVITMKAAVLQGAYDKYPQERREIENFVVNGAAAVKQGKNQGDPFDPRALEDILKQYRKTFIFTGGGDYKPVFCPLVTPAGGEAGQYGPGQGQAVALHTRPQSEAPEQAALLPPIPVKK